jgi:LDH2 family malate/lactate/ureidoglycolate dehydrogenase
VHFINIITNCSNYLCGLVDTMRADYYLLKKYVASVFTAIGCNEQDAALASDVLVSADARGIDSHGVARLAGYVRLFDLGRLNTKPQIKILHETPSTATLDGDRGLGLVVAPKAMKIACEKAAIAGTGWVAVQNSNPTRFLKAISFLFHLTDFIYFI